MTSMRLRVIVAMMGCRLESELIVLNVNFLSSGPGAAIDESGAAVDMDEVRRACAGLSTQRAFSATACSSVELNSYPPLGMSVTDQRLKPSLMQMSVASATPLSHFRVLRTPTTSREAQSSWRDFSCSSCEVYAPALTTRRSWGPSFSLVLKNRERWRVERWGRREKGMTS
jgi:hypothetical protein